MKAIVLSRRDFREFDQIVSLFTLERGKAEFLAKGIKKITSKNTAHLELFSLVEIEVAEGREIDHITRIVPGNYFAKIRRDLRRSMAAGYVVSAIDKLVRAGEKDERLFCFLKSWLDFVNFQPSGLSPEVGLPPAGDFRLLVDCFIVVLLCCLGFDMTASSAVKTRLRGYLDIMRNGELEKVVQIGFDDGKELHDAIYNFTVFHTEVKLADWALVLTE